MKEGKLMTEGRPKAVIYLRVSTDRQAKRGGEPEGYSLPSQRRDCLRVLSQRGWDLAGEYIDAGDSARTDNRPQLQAMLARVAEGDIAGVVVHKVDRFARNTEDHFPIRAVIRKIGCEFVSATENIGDDPSGRMAEGILAVMADFYSANLSAEIRKGAAQKARTGGTPGRAPIGYLNVRKMVDGQEVRTVEIDDERAPFVRHAFEAFSTGSYTLDSLVAELTAMGLTTRPTAKQPAIPLNRAHLSKMLHNPYYIGIVRWGGAEYAGRHEPLVSAELFERVREILRAHDVAGEKRRKHHHYLKGSVFCRACGSRLCITRAKGRYFYFFCNGRAKGNGCRQQYVPLEDVEDAVIDFYSSIELEPERVQQIKDDIRSELADMRRRGLKEAKRQERRLAKLSAERMTLMQAHYAQAIPLEVLKIEQDRITREVAEAEAILETRQVVFRRIESTLEKTLNLADNAQAQYRAAGPKVRRMLNQALFKRLLVEDGRIGGAELTDAFAALLAEDIAKKAYERAPAPSFSGVGSNKRDLVELRGFEPLTSSMPWRRATNCATAPGCARLYQRGLAL